MTKRLLPILTATAMGMALASTADANTLPPPPLHELNPIISDTFDTSGPCNGADSITVWQWSDLQKDLGVTNLVDVVGVEASVSFGGPGFESVVLQHGTVAIGPGTPGTKEDLTVLEMSPLTYHGNNEAPAEFGYQWEQTDHADLQFACTAPQPGVMYYARVVFHFYDPFATH